MKGEIISLTSAPDWCALIRTPGADDTLMGIPLIGWALVRQDGTNRVCGLIVTHAGQVASAEDGSDFLGYAPTWMSEEGVWGDVVRKVVAHNATPPVKAAPADLQIVFSGTD